MGVGLWGDFSENVLSTVKMFSLTVKGNNRRITTPFNTTCLYKLCERGRDLSVICFNGQMINWAVERNFETLAGLTPTKQGFTEIEKKDKFDFFFITSKIWQQ